VSSCGYLQLRRISLCYNAVPQEAWQEIINVFQSGQFSPGPRVREFEQRWARFHRARHAIFVNSGTDALRLSLLAMKEKYQWSDGDLVVVPALTFPATINVIIQANLKPFFVDVGMSNFLINSWNLERRIETGRMSIKVVMPVH